MINLKRIVFIEKNKSYLLLGSRQTGKSTLARALLEEKDLYINLLPQAEFLKYTKDPGRFHAEVSAHYRSQGEFLCIVDEVQKIPELLNDVHDLIETTKIKFLLTGSSARSLRHKGVNLLAGRVIAKYLFPFVYTEIGKIFSLEKALLYGTLPRIWNGELSNHKDIYEFLSSYSHTYLREEIQQEGVIRKLGAFTRFLDVAAVNDGQIVNYSTVARDCGVSIKTIQGYYEILEDTFLAYRLNGWSKSIRKQLTAHPKYYFFDCGITNALCHINKETLNSEEKGRRFEQFIFLQMIALNQYKNFGYDFYHWRDKNGQEVDLLITKNMKIICAVEFKSSLSITAHDTKGLLAFRSENDAVLCCVVGCEGLPRQTKDGVYMYNWKDFLEEIFPKLE